MQVNSLDTIATESRPMIVLSRLAHLEDRLSSIYFTVDRACITLSGVSTQQPEAKPPKSDSEVRPRMGLYAEALMAIERLNELCDQIEKAITEAVR